MMELESKINDVCLAFKFALLDHLYSISEIGQIIFRSELLTEKFEYCEDEIQIRNFIEEKSNFGNIKNASKILLQFLHKKVHQEDPNFNQILKTLDTLPWLNGLEEIELQKIEELIYLNEDENFEISRNQVEKVKEIVNGYSKYDIKIYLTQ